MQLNKETKLINEQSRKVNKIDTDNGFGLEIQHQSQKYKVKSKQGSPVG